MYDFGWGGIEESAGGAGGGEADRAVLFIISLVGENNLINYKKT